MERFFVFSLFLYLLSALLATASGRDESKYSLPVSKCAYLAGSGVAGLILIFRLRVDGGWVIPDFFEGVLFTLVMLAVVFLLSQRRLEWPFVSGIFSVLSIILGILALFRLNETPQAVQTPSGALSSHTICMFVALAAFSLSFVFSLLFLTQEMLIKKRQIGKMFLNLPPLELTSRFNFAALAVGTAAYSIGVLGGFVQLKMLDETARLWQEPGAILSVLMLLAYVFLVTSRIGPLERARTVSFTSMIYYVLLIFVFFGAHA